MTDSALLTALTDLGLEPQATDAGTLAVAVPSEARGNFIIEIQRTERAVRLRSFIMRRPDRHHLEVYARLMRKNLDARDWRFALDDDGDVYITAYVPPTHVEGDLLDGLLGAAVALVDAVFEGIARTGFDIPPGMALRPPAPGDGESPAT